jgi:lipid-A-disaccharide synthase
MRFLISAGEASGELYGAGLIKALRDPVPDAEFFGVGGQRMRDVGFDVTIDAHQISVVGLAEVITHLPHIYCEFHRLVREARARKPDAAILIDFPDFNLRLARELHAFNIPVIYYVGPQLWAWRSGRIKHIQRYVNKMLVIFPFEEEFYQQHAVSVEYVGHPLADEQSPAKTREEFAAESNIDATKPWVALLPGSRKKEFTLNKAGILAAADQLGDAKYEFILPVASSLDREWVVHQLLVQSHRGTRVPKIHLVAEARLALLHSRAAIVASGTATLETALIGTPFVMVYRVSPLTWLLGRRLVKVDRFAMPNLIAGRDVVPEFVQDRFQPTAVAAKVRQLLEEGPERQDMLQGLAEVKERLHSPGDETASQRAAAAVMEVVGSSK